MEITFDTDNFDGSAKALSSVLYYLKGCDSYNYLGHNPDVEKITCKTPSEALRYTKWVTGSIGVSPEAEKVFLKNPNLAIRYLKYIRRDHFVDPKVQQRWWKKVVKKSEIAYDWARNFNKRLSEEEEEVFAKGNMKYMKDYAMYVIKGKFPEKVHQIIVLRSFEELSQWEKSAVKDYMKFIGE